MRPFKPFDEVRNTVRVMANNANAYPVTGKKARFEEIPRWQDFDTYGIRALETVKLMFGFCQESGGRYYGEETENRTAASPKKVAAEARGLSGHETELLTLEEFFKKEFAGR